MDSACASVHSLFAQYVKIHKKSKKKFLCTQFTGSWGFWVAPEMKKGRDPTKIREEIEKRRRSFGSFGS